MSTLAFWIGMSGRGKGQTAEAYVFPGHMSWVVREHLPDCHIFVECYHSMTAVGFLLP